MKYIIFAIVCLAGTTLASDVCHVECSTESGNWTGNSSAVIELGSNTEIIYEVNYKILVILNIRENLAFATNGKILLVLNIQTGDYILIDYTTYYAVHGKIENTWKNSDGSIDYSKLILEINNVLTRYQSITSSTNSSFNFNLIVTSFYNYQFNLSIIFEGRGELVIKLKESFSGWFKLIQSQISNGNISRAKGMWGFFIVMIELDIEVASAFITIIRASIEYYRVMETRLIVEIVRMIRYDIRILIQYAVKFQDILSTGVNISIDNALQWASDMRNNPVSVSLSFLGTRYTFTTTRINSVYVVRFTIRATNNRSIEIKMILIRNVLIIINLETNIVMAYYGRSFVLTNSTTSTLFVGTQVLFNVNGTFAIDTALKEDIKGQSYAKLAERVITLINKYHMSTTLTFTELRSAVLSGSVLNVGKLVGSTYASQVIASYSVFFSETVDGSFGGIAIGVFGIKSDGLAITCSRTIQSIASSRGSWSFFFKNTGIIKGSISSGK